MKRHSEMSQPERRRFSGEEKARILRLHLLEAKAVSELCENEVAISRVYVKSVAPISILSGLAFLQFQAMSGSSPLTTGSSAHNAAGHIHRVALVSQLICVTEMFLSPASKRRIRCTGVNVTQH